MPGALPAVTVPSVASPRSSPSGRAKAGLSFARASAVESRRGPSSVVTMVSRPFASRTVTGASSASKRPASMAAIAFWWLARANASWSSRLTCSLIATRSAWVPMWQSSMEHHRPSLTVESIELGVAEAEPEPRARQHVRRAVHRFHAARDDELGVAGADLRCGQHDGLEPGAADAVDRRGAGAVRESCLERGLSRRGLPDAGLEDLAHEDVVDLGASPGRGRRARRQPGWRPRRVPSRGPCSARHRTCRSASGRH